MVRKVNIDLRSADADLRAEPPVVEDALFHCQQTIEKSLKGFLAWHNRAFQKIHDLRKLAESCLSIEPELEAILSRVPPLTGYAWVFRYPGETPDATVDEAQAALDLARAVVNAVLSRLPPEIRPQLKSS